MNISNRLTFRVKTFQLSLSMKSQLNVISSSPKRFDSRRKIFHIFKCLIITASTLQSRSSCYEFLIAHLINTVQFNVTYKLSLLPLQKCFSFSYLQFDLRHLTVASPCSMLTIWKWQIALI